MSKAAPQIVFVTGTSASGKTTLYESLQTDGDFSNTSFHDIDEAGTPPVGREAWRRYRVANLLHDAAQTLESDQSTIICGITKPHEVLEAEHYSPELSVSFILVEVSDDLIRERLQARAKQDAAAGQWNESTADIERMVNANLRLKKVLHNSVSALRQGAVIDASELSKQALHDRAKDLIMKAGQP